MYMFGTNVDYEVRIRLELRLKEDNSHARRVALLSEFYECFLREKKSDTPFDAEVLRVLDALKSHK